MPSKAGSEGEAGASPVTGTCYRDDVDARDGDSTGAALTIPDEGMAEGTCVERLIPLSQRRTATRVIDERVTERVERRCGLTTLQWQALFVVGEPASREGVACSITSLFGWLGDAASAYIRQPGSARRRQQAVRCCGGKRGGGRRRVRRWGKQGTM